MFPSLVVKLLTYSLPAPVFKLHVFYMKFPYGLFGMANHVSSRNTFQYKHEQNTTIFHSVIYDYSSDVLDSQEKVAAVC